MPNFGHRGASSGRIVRSRPYRADATTQVVAATNKLKQIETTEELENVVQGVRITAPIAHPGLVIPKTYGTVRVPGYVMWLGNYDKENKTIDFAMLLAEGFVKGIRRIWLPSKGKLLYSAKSLEAIEGQVISHSRWKFLRLHYGTATQSPDALIVSQEGSDNVSAYRDTAYVVIADWRLDKSDYEIPPLDFELIGTTTFSEEDLEIEHEYYELYAESTSCISCTDIGSIISKIIAFEDEIWIGYFSGSVRSYSAATNTCTARGVVSSGNEVWGFAISDVRGQGDELYACAGETVRRWNADTSAWVTTNFPSGIEIFAIAARPGGKLYAVRGNKIYWTSTGTSWTALSVTLPKFHAGNGSGFYDADRDLVYFSSNGGAGGVYIYSITNADSYSSVNIGGSGEPYQFETDDSNIYVVQNAPEKRVLYKINGIGSWQNYSGIVGSFPESILLFNNLLHVASGEAINMEIFRDDGNGNFALINDLIPTGFRPHLSKDSAGNLYCAMEDCLYTVSDETA